MKYRQMTWQGILYIYVNINTPFTRMRLNRLHNKTHNHTRSIYTASKAIGKDLPRYGACTRPLIKTFSPKVFMFPMPSCLNYDWIHALGKGFSGSMHPMNSAALLYSLLKYASTVELEIPRKTCYLEAVPKRRGQLTRAWNIRWNAMLHA